MNQPVIDLRDKLDAKVKEAHKLLENPTQESLMQAGALNDEIKTLRTQLEGVTALDDTVKSASQFMNFGNGTMVHGFKDAGKTLVDGPSNRVEQYGEGVLSERQIKAITDSSYKSAMASYLRDPSGRKIDSHDFKTLQEGADSAGGFLLPEEWLQRLIEKKPTPTRVNEKVTKLNCAGDSLTIPRSVYNTDDLWTTNMRATWTGEIPASSTAAQVTDPTFGQTTINIFTAMMTLPISRNLMEDAGFDITAWVQQKFFETIDLFTDQTILKGTGNGQPTGIMVSPGSTFSGQPQPAVVSMGNPFTFSGVTSVAWDVAEQYDENLGWVFNKTNVGKTLAQMVDSQGRPLWSYGYNDSGIMNPPPIRQRTLEGYPVYYSGFMPNTGANNYPVIFGDLTGYAWITRVGASIEILREILATTNQVLAVLRFRAGGQVIEPWKLRIGQQA